MKSVHEGWVGAPPGPSLGVNEFEDGGVNVGLFSGATGVHGSALHDKELSHPDVSKP